MNRLELINRIARKNDAKSYLEIGVFRGELFDKVEVGKRIAVDPKFMISKKKRLIDRLKSGFKIKYYEKTSDDYFKRIDEKNDLLKIDIAFVDGLHTWNQTYEDIKNCLRFLSETGVVLVHDCIPPHRAAAQPAESFEAAARLDLQEWNGEWTGDVWKAIVQLRSEGTDLDIFVLDTDYGIAVIRTGENRKDLNYTVEEIEKMDFSFFIANKEKLLNIKPIEFLDLLKF